MYGRILKRDLKRKKTMNVILLLFVILASLFVSSSVNNILSVTNALDYFFDKAGAPDYFVATVGKTEMKPITEVLDQMDKIEKYGTEDVLYLGKDNILKNHKKFKKQKNSSILHSYEDSDLTFFDEDDKPVKPVREGEVLIPCKCMKSENLVIGDTITITIENITKDFIVAGGFKDAVLGSEMMGMSRFIVNRKDFDFYFKADSIQAMYGGKLCYIEAEDTKQVEEIINQNDSGVAFMGNKDMLKQSYMLNMIIAGVLLVVSICLILIAFVVLRFTITFTLTEEFREIGVMKAIGIGNNKIRGLYIVKYLAIAVVGSVLGLIAGIPFGKMLLQSVSQTMVMGGIVNYGVNIVCSILVVGVILLFCFTCTGKLKRFTPVDAIRSGSTGERFGKKGILSLSKTRLKNPAFMAANDVLSSPKRYLSIILTFTLSMLLLLVIVNTANTLRSGRLITCFGIKQSDMYLTSEGMQMSYMTDDGREKILKEIQNIEDTLEKEGMPAKCSNEIMFKMSLHHGTNTCISQVMQSV